MTFALRPYQTDGVAAIRAAFKQHQAVCWQLPTGGGKTVGFNYIAEHAAAKGNRVLILAHRRELIRQASRKLQESGVRHGLVVPGHTMTDDMVQVGSVQTVGRRLDRVPAPDLIVVDEAHHSISPTYGKIFAAFPSAKRLGVTATPARLDGRGLGAAFTSLILGPTIQELIDGGYLARFDYYAPPTSADLSGVATRGGDYAVDQLAAAMDKAAIIGDCVAHLQRLAPKARAIVFGVSVDHARHIAERFRAAGFTAAAVDGRLSERDRDAVIAGFASGAIQIMTSCDLVGEGLDIPECDAVVLERPTKSLTLFLQQVGRCLRPKADGRRALILDHVNNASRHGLPTDEREWSLEGRRRRAAASTVSQCKLCYRAWAPPGPAFCPDGAAECPYTAEVEKAARAAPEQQDGELVAISAVQPAWLPVEVGIRTAPLREVVAHARTLAHLQEIAKARGYKSQWAWMQWQARRKRAVAVPVVGKVA